MRERKPYITRICTVCQTADEDGVLTYGVEMVSGGAVMVFPDVDLSAEVVDRLICRLQDERVEPCHFYDVVTDYIEKLATPSMVEFVKNS